MIQLSSPLLFLLLLIFIISIGNCQPQMCPESCAAIYKPVCGSDNKTYGNACSLAQASEPCKPGSVVVPACDCECPCLHCISGSWSLKDFLKTLLSSGIMQIAMGRLTFQQLRRLRLKKVISMKNYLRAVQLKKLSSRTTDPRPRFNLVHLSDRDCELMFRFTSDEILRIAKVLGIPRTIRLKNKTKFKGIEGLCIALRRLCYPNRLYDLVETFGRDPSSLSRISNYMIRWIYKNFAKSVQTLDQHWLTRDKWSEFAEACTARGSVYPNIVGFIDGTGRAICRPSVRQEEYYSGYYKEHLAKYQSIMLPNGIIGRLDGPFKGRRHDSAIVHLSGIIPEMQKLFTNQEDGTWYSLYGDAGYANQKFIKVGFKNVKVHSEVHKEFNSHMSKLRVSVEYGFGKIIQLFAILDFKKNQKLLLQPIKQQYFVGALLTNMHTCLRGSQISQYFNCEPPTLEEYLTKMGR